MKRLTLEATDENILNSIRLNTYNRNIDVKDFVETLDMIESNMFISLDARWGEGKTFYVRQIEKTLEFLTKRLLQGEHSNLAENLEPFFRDTELSTIVLEKSYLPIYYNAWLYDNHDDPLMSLILTITKKAEQNFDFKLQESIKSKILSFLSSISVSISNTPISVDFESAKNTCTGFEILDNVKTSEQIRDLVKEILNDVIVETAEKLVIFIDELDRCKPSYAIEMLERIKHYFDDDRIIFIASVNKEQLIHTISKYYGIDFDSTAYLNKFFDLNLHLPVITCEKRDLFEKNNQTILKSIADELIEYYKLSLRDSLIFKQKISFISSEDINDFTTQGRCLSLFLPIITILDIVDESEKTKFLNGSSDILEILSTEIPAIYELISLLGENKGSYHFESGFSKIKDIYRFTFRTMDKTAYDKLNISIDFNLKGICIKLCNRVV